MLQYKKVFIRYAWSVLLAAEIVVIVSCMGNSALMAPGSSSASSTSSSQDVLMWKGNRSGNGLYNEGGLNLQNVNPNQFGKLAEHQVDGEIMAQPIYLSHLKMANGEVHDVVIVATEHDSVYAFDAGNLAAAPLWERHYAVNGATPAPDNFGGRTTIGGQVGITGTPVVDGSTGIMYFVTTIQVNGVVEQWLCSIDVHTGNDAGAGSVKIEASVPGDGVGSQNGVIPFTPENHNQRAGLVIAGDSVVIAWGSFSDYGIYHGWLMAYGLSDLKQKAILNLATQHQDTDVAFGPSDFGGGASVWQGGAAPSIDDAGNIYVVAADGSFNADKGGANYGDTVLRLRLDSAGFHIADWFAPSNYACIDEADMEIGSGGVAQIPGSRLGLTVSKEGRLFLLNLDSLGHLSANDAQIPQHFLAGANECFDGVGPDHAEGNDWQRLYGNPTYWNGNVFLAPSNGTLRQYVFQNGRINPTPTAQSPNIMGPRGGNTVISQDGSGNAIVWLYEKTANGTATLHAYNAANVGNELWNSNINPRDAMNGGASFGTPVVAGGRVIAGYGNVVAIYGPLSSS